MRVALDATEASGSNDRLVAKDLIIPRHLRDMAATEDWTGPSRIEFPASKGNHYVSETKAEIECHS